MEGVTSPALAAPLIAIAFIAASCSSAPESAAIPADSFVVQGTMEFLNIETGCWVLNAIDGKRYQPAGEDLNILWKNGLIVSLRVRRMGGIASICQAGQIVEVLEILKTEEP